MQKNSIPVNTIADKFGAGIAIGKASIKELRTFEETTHSHRDDFHLFFLLEKGTFTIEIDFKKFEIAPLSIVYIHPNQVHRLGAFENVTVSFWVINNENLNPEYLKLLETIAPAKPLSLNKDAFLLISQAALLCIRISESNQENLYHSLLKDSCNTLVGLAASQYLALSKSTDPLSRAEAITKTFKTLLERDFITHKKPGYYAQSLHISTHYLNECVKKATGNSVSNLIQHRVILEAKRLLYHSNRSVKEIAFELGFDDYPYFSRLFSKATGITALTFRKKNSD